MLRDSHSPLPASTAYGHTLCYQRRHRKKCNFKQSVFKNTFFDCAHLAVPTILRFVAYCVHLPPPRQNFLVSKLSIAKQSVTDWLSFYREVCIYYRDSVTEAISGIEEIVEVDESKIGKRKCNRGRRVEGQWVFGGVLRSNPSKCYIVPVEKRSKAR